MPADRFFHPRAGHSRKVTSLTDLEFRVWWTYQLTADDFGVMPLSSVVLQAANDSLAARSKRAVKMALDRIVEVGLLVPFEHQGHWFVCQLDWQDFQKIRYPRETLYPSPSPELLQKCSSETSALFQKHSRKISEIDRKHFGKISVPPRAGAREEARGLRLTANGYRQPADSEKPDKPATSLEPDEVAERAGRLLNLYQELYPKHRNGAKLRLIGNSVEFEDACSLVRTWDLARLEKLAVLVLVTDDPFIAKTDRSFKIFAMKASWADDKLKVWELENGVTA